jgi:hypothetical protein
MMTEQELRDEESNRMRKEINDLSVVSFVVLMAIVIPMILGSLLMVPILRLSKIKQ